MIPYEEFLPLLPHEYSYALYLSYGFDLCMYDPMILNMVSKRYPRDEDYASDSDSDSVTDEDFSDTEYDVPPWMFADFEEEDTSLLHHENNRLEIVFGNFDQVSDLEKIPVAPQISIIPKFSDSSVKIGEITCFLNSGYSPSKNVISADNVNRGAILESRIVKDLGSRSNDFVFGCNNWSTVKPETRMCGDVSSVLNPEVKDEETHKTVNNDCTFSEQKSKTINLEKEASLIPDHFLVPKIAPDQFHHTCFMFGKVVSPSIVVPSPEKTVERCFTMKETLVANDFVMSSLFFGNLDSELNDSQLYDLFNQICEVVSVCVCRNFATQQSLDKELDLKQSSLMSYNKFLHCGDDSTSLFNRSSNALIASIDDFVCAKSLPLEICAKSFPKFPVLEEMMKEIEEDTALPWKLREEDELQFAHQRSLVCSPSPPWELLLRREASDSSWSRAFHTLWLFSGHVLGQNFGPYHFRPSLVGQGHAWAAFPYWANVHSLKMFCAKEYPP